MTESATGVARPAAADAELSAAIGTNAKYYVTYLTRAEGRPWAPSWNWPAFFVTSAWMLYRKLWLPWLVYSLLLPAAVAVTVAVVTALFGDTPGNLLNLILLVGLFFVAAPAFANALVARRVRRLVERARADAPSTEARLAWLRRHGGTSWLWLLMVILPVLVGMLAALAMPAYQDYLLSARTAQVDANVRQAQIHIEAEMRAARAAVAAGNADLTELGRRWTTHYWVRTLNFQGATNPLGGPAYGIEADNAAGVVGVEAAGTLSGESADYRVRLSRPSFGGLAAGDTDVVWAAL